MLDKDIARVLITEEQLHARTEELGQQISRDYAGKELVLVCVLKGGVVFLADLTRAGHASATPSTLWPSPAMARPPNPAAWCAS